MGVLITGASAGFGAATCRLLVEQGLRVIGAARREEKLQTLKAELGDKFLPLRMDVSDLADVDRALASLPDGLGDIDLLVNNAGLALGQEPAQECDFRDWLTMIQTNVIGLAYVTHKILPAMVARKRGQIINIGSIAGTYPYPGGNVYGATKAFVRQFSLNLRADLAGTGLRVTDIEPGLCGDTEFSYVRYKGDAQRAENLYADVEFIRPEDIAQMILWIYRTPAHVNINRVEVMPTAQSSAALNVWRG